jgi:Lrp/AsnC family leucine-responsive transcriptional regulator
MTIDDSDRKILTLLQENAKLTTKEIADKLGLSVTPVYERIKRLEKHKYIKGYVALVDRKKVDKSLMAFLFISLKEHSQKALLSFENEILKFPKVIECYHIAGQYDFLLKILVKDMQDYHEFTFHRLATLDNIAHVQTDFVMNDLKYSTQIPID